MNPLFSVQVFYSVGYQVAAIVSVTAIMLACLWAIFSDRVKDGLIGRAIYSIGALAALAALIHMAQGTFPQRTTITLESCAALWACRQVFVYYFWDTTRRKYFFELRRLRSQRKAHERDY